MSVGNQGRARVSRDQLLDGAPGLATILEPVLAGLSGAGLIADAPGPGPSVGGAVRVPTPRRRPSLSHIVITEFGLRVLQDLREAGLEADVNDAAPPV
jgi:hypothetical protein